MSKRPVSPHALALYFRQFATLLGAGVSLLRLMRIIGETTSDERLREVNADMAASIEAGKTLSQAMEDHPDAFSPIIRALVRAGEVGGVLDEMADRLAGYLETDLELRERFYLYCELARLRSTEAGEEIEQRVRDVLQRTRSRVVEALFWRALGEMLTAGVPLPLAVECAAELYEGEPQAAIEQVAKSDLQDKPLVGELEGTGLFSTAPLELCRVGDEVGALDLMCRKAADLLELETLSMLREALPQPPSGEEVFV
jgi:type II secretory pathway component PulF